MNKNVFVVLGTLIIAGVATWGYMGMQKNKVMVNDAPPALTEARANNDTPVSPIAGVTVNAPTATTGESSVKEFTMTAYYDEKGKWFSLKEIAVKKGDTVRVKITNTKGMHDFVIDELGVKKELSLNQEVTVEFTADRVGDFVYYCSMKGHREGGQWGTLKVTE